MDLEGYCRREIKKGINEKKILSEISNLILKIKFRDKDNTGNRNKSKLLAEAILEEVKKTNQKIDNKFLFDLLNFPKSDVSMGEIGVGSRGKGDFFVHEKICEIASNNIGKFNNVVVGAKEHDDAGIVSIGNAEKNGENEKFVVVSVDGTHSRLSEYPFIAGFHVARASLRDIYVKGAKPIALLDDLHLADDGDVGRLFDFVAGISTVSELADVPLVAGSTLRIGGDMVIGERMVSCVGAVGIINALNFIKARKNVRVGDRILMTGGAGGGTIATTAIYSGNFDVVLETLNITFIKACKILHEKNLLTQIDAMLDVTNGGIRGDAYEVLNLLNNKKDACLKKNVSLKFYESKIKNLINKKVYEMLKNLNIDELGVSLDSLMLFVPPENCGEIIKNLRKGGIEIDEIGEIIETEEDNGKILLTDENGNEKTIEPLFRESAYTKIKKVVGEQTPEKFEEMKKNVNEAYQDALKKKQEILKFIAPAGI